VPKIVSYFFELPEFLIQCIDASLDGQRIGQASLHGVPTSDLRSDFEQAFRYGAIIQAANRAPPTGAMLRPVG